MKRARVRVDLDGGGRGYDVEIGPGLLDAAPGLVRASVPGGVRAFVVEDQGVPVGVRDRLAHGLGSAGLTTARWALAPSEAVKSIATLERVLAAMAGAGLTRADVVVALGGGIVGDLAGFAAGVHRRGVAVVQCPTTLLAMVDASVGGKTGVNLEAPGLGLLKNAVGAFHQPVLVVADPGVLASLPTRQVRAGLGECVKHAMIARGVVGTDLWGPTLALIGPVLDGDAEAVTELVEASVRLKAEVVRRDEREAVDGGERMLLNLGHTFGHAIETIGHLSPDAGDASLAPLHHGEAVALGLVAASRCAQALGLCAGEVGDAVERALERAGLPTRVAGLPDDQTVLARMGADKKGSGGSMRLVLPTELGVCRVVKDPDAGAVRAGLGAIRV